MAKRIGRNLESSKPQASPEFDPAIVDTVVLRYFLLVERFDLLARSLGEPLMVSRIVYDYEDRGEEQAMSEMVRSIYVQNRRSNDPKRTSDERDRAGVFAGRLAKVHEVHAAARISVIDMTEPELDLYGQLTNPARCADFGLVFPLDDGEAASLAIALERGWVFATDDGDALRAMRKIRRRHPYQRIRKILIEAARQGIIDPAEANAIHAEMRQCGFWDVKPPFPKEAE